ncbi:YCF48-related protein [Balneolales bacterium ANBcel1]|nr:YCF48-related protein [Balneolales bacterium ANBcel1]
MKKAVQFMSIMILFFSAATAQENWTTVLEADFPGFINDIHFLSETEGWAVGTNGTIKRTDDGGLTWTDHSTAEYAGDAFTSVFFVDEETGWIGSSSAFLLKTIDGGNSWVQTDFQDVIEHLDINLLRRIQFLNAETGFMLTGRHNNNFMLRTDDGGETWAVQDSLIGANWLDFDFYDTDRGVLVSNNPDGQFHTVDGGENWLQANNLPAISNLTLLNAVRWLDENTVVAMGQGNSFQNLPTTVYYSTDGGATFEPAAFDEAMTVDVFTGLQVIDADHVIAVGHDRATRPVIARSMDAGRSWSTELLDFNANFQKTSLSGSKLFIQGSSSNLFVSEDFGETVSQLPVHPYSEIRAIQFTEDGAGFAVNASSSLFVYEESSGKFVYHGSTLHNSPGRGNNMFFQNASTGIIQKGNRQIVKTTDGGAAWSTVLEDVPNIANNRSGGVTFTDDDTGYAWMSLNTGAAYYIYKTTDGGESWNEHLQFTGPANVIGQIRFFDDNNGFIAGPNRVIMRTSDAFETVEMDTLSAGFPEGFSESADFRSAVVVDETTAWAVGDKFIVKTEDAGQTWQWVDHGVADIDSNFYALAVQGEVAYAATFGGYIIKTEDGGESWTADDTFAGERIFITAAFNGNRVYIGSTVGEIVAGEEYIDDVPTGLAGIDHPVHIRLDQNYPNPFNPATQISFAVPDQQRVHLSVYNMIGQQVAVLVDETLQAGTHQVAFDAANLASGVYIYRLSTGTTSLTRKMMLIK